MFYPVSIVNTSNGDLKISEYLRNSPFDNVTQCIKFCNRKKIRYYSVEEQIKERIFFDDNLEWIWKTFDYKIVENKKGK